MNEWLQVIIEEFQSVFKLTLLDKLSPKQMFKHSINISDIKSVNINAYSLSQLQLNKQTKQITELMNKDLICESASSWDFLILFIKKKKSTWWMYIDYRVLNNITVKNEYSLLWIQKCLNWIDKAQYLIKLDLTLSYYQVCVIKDDMKKTVFNTHYDKYKFTAMLFELCNALMTFQSMMNSILWNLLNKFCLIYLNNILIFSDSISDHQKHLWTILSILKKHKLYAKSSKCTVETEILKFCEHIVKQDTLWPVSVKISVIKNWSASKTAHYVWQFLKLTLYYQWFVQGFVWITALLSDLLKKNNIELHTKKNQFIIWNALCNSVFQQLKNALTSESILI